MKTTIIGLLLLATASVNAQEKAQTYQLADAPRYSEETGYGYDLVATPEKGSKAPFFFSPGKQETGRGDNSKRRITPTVH